MRRRRRRKVAPRWFRLTILQELLNVEQFCPWKFNKIKTKKLCLITTTMESSQ
jgi:hypothetical protein